ncbi:MAG: hypothetical protein J3Q66DRAFT_176542 [Benniella sp.]|nr:MAG: hypothetical protein J3Q66DRAFT_176542 [Benniella sp.]
MNAAPPPPPDPPRLPRQLHRKNRQAARSLKKARRLLAQIDRRLQPTPPPTSQQQEQQQQLLPPVETLADLQQAHVELLRQQEFLRLLQQQRRQQELQQQHQQQLPPLDLQLQLEFLRSLQRDTDTTARNDPDPVGSGNWATGSKREPTATTATSTDVSAYLIVTLLEKGSCPCCPHISISRLYHTYLRL